MPETTSEKCDLFTLDINSGWVINQFYQTLDTQFWYTIFLHLSSTKFSEEKYKFWIILLVTWNPLLQGFFSKSKYFPS